MAVAAGGIAPHGLADAIVGEHLARAAAQELHQAVFIGGEVHRLPGQCDQVLIIVDGQLAGGKGGKIGGGPGPAQRCPDAGQQLRGAERLGDIVVGATIQGGHLFAFLGAGGDHDDRQAIALPQLPQQLQPIGIRQAQIQQHGTKLHLFQRRTGLGGTGSHLHGVAIALQHGFHKIADGKFVLDDQDLIHHVLPPLFPPAAA